MDDDLLPRGRAPGFSFAGLIASLLSRFAYALRGSEHQGNRIQVFRLYFSRRDAHVGEIFELLQEIHKGHRVNQSR